MHSVLQICSWAVDGNLGSGYNTTSVLYTYIHVLVQHNTKLYNLQIQKSLCNINFILYLLPILEVYIFKLITCSSFMCAAKMELLDYAIQCPPIPVYNIFHNTSVCTSNALMYSCFICFCYLLSYTLVYVCCRDPDTECTRNKQNYSAFPHLLKNITFFV